MHNDPVFMKPADLCCLKRDFHHGEPKGDIIRIKVVNTYIAKPDLKATNKNVLLFFPDIFRLYTNSLDNRCLCRLRVSHAWRRLLPRGQLPLKRHVKLSPFPCRTDVC